jgi:hypothetical protein
VRLRYSARVYEDVLPVTQRAIIGIRVARLDVPRLGRPT